MFDVAALWGIVFVGLVGGLTVTLTYWFYVNFLAWRQLRKDLGASANSFHLWLWSARELIQNTNYLRLFVLATGLWVLLFSVEHMA